MRFLLLVALLPYLSGCMAAPVPAAVSATAVLAGAGGATSTAAAEAAVAAGLGLSLASAAIMVNAHEEAGVTDTPAGRAKRTNSSRDAKGHLYELLATDAIPGELVSKSDPRDLKDGEKMVQVRVRVPREKKYTYIPYKLVGGAAVSMGAAKRRTVYAVGPGGYRVFDAMSREGNKLIGWEFKCHSIHEQSNNRYYWMIQSYFAGQVYGFARGLKDLAKEMGLVPEIRYGFCNVGGANLRGLLRQALKVQVNITWMGHYGIPVPIRPAMTNKNVRSILVALERGGIRDLGYDYAPNL